MAMQESILGSLDEQIDGGGLALLADVQGALAALDDVEASSMPADVPMARAVVRDAVPSIRVIQPRDEFDKRHRQYGGIGLK